MDDRAVDTEEGQLYLQATSRRSWWHLPFKTQMPRLLHPLRPSCGQFLADPSFARLANPPSLQRNPQLPFPLGTPSFQAARLRNRLGLCSSGGWDQLCGLLSLARSDEAEGEGGTICPGTINGEWKRRRRATGARKTSKMKTLLLLAFLAAATFCLCHADDASVESNRAKDAPGSKAFVSRRESAEVVKRHKRNYNRLFPAFSAQVAVTPDPFEAHREVCETNPSCDELADHIGFQEAYRRFYGPI
ncbi:osteocalcin [Sceloporus undulatus]|uniref:osteocalcin n=1 Tax=Sceloporus undulatus TaxID=8520 RepID=UPI001C4D92E1|nr:osteocalcin [Sceloporus undulatus]